MSKYLLLMTNKYILLSAKCQAIITVSEGVLVNSQTKKEDRPTGMYFRNSLVTKCGCCNFALVIEAWTKQHQLFLCPPFVGMMKYSQSYSSSSSSSSFTRSSSSSGGSFGGSSTSGRVHISYQTNGKWYFVSFRLPWNRLKSARVCNDYEQVLSPFQSKNIFITPETLQHCETMDTHRLRGNKLDPFLRL